MMKQKYLNVRKLFLAAAMTAVLCSCSDKMTQQANLEIVPRPNDIEIIQQGQPKFGSFVIDSKTVIVSENDENQFNAEYLQSYLKNAIDGDFLIKDNAGNNSISLEINDEIADNEAYILIVDGNGITIQGGATAGVFYGVQTLIQMLPAQAYNKGNDVSVAALEVPAMRINDAPRFHYRGLHFDVSRTFFGMEFMYKLLDAMSYYKINNLHWHLADDQGWRVEIKAYPRLTELGAWRGPDELLKPAYGSGMERNGGFYTQEEIKAVVKYAADRNINIIPEIDLPGHSKAVAVTYPEILCDINTKHYSCQWESNNVWCVGREENYEMLEDIIKELVELFPSKVFHIGGDEVNMNLWKDCPRCQALMKEKGMTQVVELQNYFVRRLEAILAKYGRTMAGWDEIIDGGELLPNSVVYAWASLERGMRSVKEGHPTVMLIAEYMYFDMKQSADERGLKWAGITPLEKTYSFDPIGTFELNENEAKLILGPQGGAWAECFQVKDYAEYQVFPKLLALSEIGWTNRELRCWDNFRSRLFDAQYDRMYVMDLKFRIAPAEVKYEAGRLIAEKENELLTIRYTDDKTSPTMESPVYNEPIATETPENYRFATFFNARSSIARGAQNIELHHYLKPATKVESNIPFMEDINRLVDYDLETYCFTSRDVTAGDYVQFTFDEPVDCHSIGMCTGYYTLAVYGILNGYIEYSYDGENYIKGERFAYDMFDGYRAYCHPERPVKAVRVVADGICEHEVTGIQDLRIE